MTGAFTIRPATEADIPVLHPLMQSSIGELQKPFLDPDAIAASREVMGIDTQLIADRTYFVVEHRGSDGRLGLAVVLDLGLGLSRGGGEQGDGHAGGEDFQRHGSS